MTHTCMCRGFDHSIGWFEIVWQLSLAIEEELGYCGQGEFFGLQNGGREAHRQLKRKGGNRTCPRRDLDLPVAESNKIKTHRRSWCRSVGNKSLR
jgi:hypothetical protein